jgi:hypothetical protein
MAQPNQLLIDKTDFAPFVQIAEYGNDAKRLNPHILNAQNLDCKFVFGNRFWTDIITNPTNYDELLNGGTYQDSDGNDISFSGLKAAIVWYSVARLRVDSNSINSPWGQVQKTSEYSQPVSTTTLNQQIAQAENNGQAYLRDVVEYLKIKESTYPLWNASCDTSTSLKSSNRFTPVSRI